MTTPAHSEAIVSIVVPAYYRTDSSPKPTIYTYSRESSVSVESCPDSLSKWVLMAPIVKDSEASGASSAASSSAPPASKSVNDAPTRPQPIALEIPVTVNGARTAADSDRRVPFSESTQTVLVLSHGAVVRVATPLAPGQLVFLTNEKTKKEVVCQVVKSKSTGTAAAYVELQFTEPSPGFWGIQVPGAPAAAASPRPAAPPAAPKQVAPAPPVGAKTTVAPKPPVAASPATPPVKPLAPANVPAIQPPPLPAASSSPAHPVAESAPVKSTPPVDSGSQVSKMPQPTVAPPPHVDTEAPSSPAAHHPVVPVTPPLRDYSREIDALFATPHPPASHPEPKITPPPRPPAPSTEDLKLQAARLQEQLSSMLFTGSPAKNVAATPPAPKSQAPAAELANKILEVSQQEQKSAIQNEAKPMVPARKSTVPPASLDEEVKIPAWLAPLSQHPQPAAVESAPAAEVAPEEAAPVRSGESFDAVVGDAHERPQTAVFGGQLLGEASGQAAEDRSSSKKGLLIGLAAAAVLVIGAGGWYYYQNTSTSKAPAPTHAANVAPAEPAAPAASASAPAVANPAPTKTASSATPLPEARKNSTPIPIPAVSVVQPERRNSNPAAKNPQPPEEAPAKPALGSVHLAAPVVSHGSDSQPVSSDALQAIDTKTVPSGNDPLAMSGGHAPVAPVPVGGNVKQAQLIKSVPPEYPAMAKAQHVSGQVQLDALIDPSGKVAGLTVLSGPVLLRKAALDAVKQWRYSPAMLDGQPTSMHLTVTVEFRSQ